MIIDHAKRELDAIGMTARSKDEMNRQMRKDILELLNVFARQRHSGFSAGYAANIFSKLVDHKPLSPLKGTDDEWVDISEPSFSREEIKKGRRLYQNRRCSSVFKDETGKAWDIEGKVFVGKDGVSYRSRDSKIPVKFPYTKKKPEMVKVAGALSTAGDQLTSWLFRKGHKDAAHVLSMDLGDVTKSAVNTVAQQQQFSHVLKDGTKITQSQFNKLGPSAQMFAKRVA